MAELDDDDFALAAQVALTRFHALLRGDAPDTVESQDRHEAIKPGMELPPWRLLEKLGAGGMGTVFLAERADGSFTKKVAVKVLNDGLSDASRQRIRQERQILAELDHPGIARLLDGGETPQGRPYLVMDLVEGQTLRQAVTERNLSLDARVLLVEQVCEAVAHAHARHVVHRDLKPANVMVTPGGEPRLLDFGVARLLAQSGDDSSTMVFTPGYAAPEQMRGGRVTERTDIYALGVMLRELITGLRPDGKPFTPPLPPVEQDAAVLRIAELAAHEDPLQRPASVEVLRDALRAWREKRQRPARPSAGAILGLVAAALVLALAAATAVALWPSRAPVAVQPPPPVQEPPQPARSEPPQPPATLAPAAPVEPPADEPAEQPPARKPVKKAPTPQKPKVNPRIL